MKTVAAYLYSLIAHFFIFVGKMESDSPSFHGYYQPYLWFAYSAFTVHWHTWNHMKVLSGRMYFPYKQNRPFHETVWNAYL